MVGPWFKVLPREFCFLEFFIRPHKITAEKDYLKRLFLRVFSCKYINSCILPKHSLQHKVRTKEIERQFRHIKYIPNWQKKQLFCLPIDKVACVAKLRQQQNANSTHPTAKCKHAPFCAIITAMQQYRGNKGVFNTSATKISKHRQQNAKIDTSATKKDLVVFPSPLYVTFVFCFCGCIARYLREVVD